MSKIDNINYFPIWEPTQRVKNILYDSLYRNEKYKALRNSSSGFIARKDVKKYIFKRDDYKCVICNSKKNLTIDHIDSVLSAFIGLTNINKLNTKKNLQTLCNSCNSTKLP